MSARGTLKAKEKRWKGSSVTVNGSWSLGSLGCLRLTVVIWLSSSYKTLSMSMRHLCPKWNVKTAGGWVVDEKRSLGPGGINKEENPLAVFSKSALFLLSTAGPIICVVSRDTNNVTVLLKDRQILLHAVWLVMASTLDKPILREMLHVIDGSVTHNAVLEVVILGLLISSEVVRWWAWMKKEVGMLMISFFLQRQRALHNI